MAAVSTVLSEWEALAARAASLLTARLDGWVQKACFGLSAPHPERHAAMASRAVLAAWGGMPLTLAIHQVSAHPRTRPPSHPSTLAHLPLRPPSPTPALAHACARPLMSQQAIPSHPPSPLFPPTLLPLTHRTILPHSCHHRLCCYRLRLPTCSKCSAGGIRSYIRSLSPHWTLSSKQTLASWAVGSLSSCGSEPSMRCSALHMTLGTPPALRMPPSLSSIAGMR